MDERTEIVDVWANNLEEEFERIRDVVEKHPYVAIDTEFPGIVARPTGNVLDYNYQTIKCNVDLLKVIQLGVTFSNGKGELPKVSTWQFNFKFDLDCDMYAQNSIDFLKLSGINFEKHQSLGIELLHFGEVIMSSGLIMNEDVKWISFHGCYDFAYLLKILTCSALPQNEAAFFDLLNDFFPSLYDIKYLLLNLNIKQLSRTFSLQKISEILCVKRIGRQHQAGSDSLVTCKTFFKLMELYFDNKIDDKKYSGVIYGLGSTIKNYAHNKSEEGGVKYSGNNMHYQKNNSYAKNNNLGMKNDNLLKGENKLSIKNGKHGNVLNIGNNMCGNTYGGMGGANKELCNKDSSSGLSHEGGIFSNIKKMENNYCKVDNVGSGSFLENNNSASLEKTQVGDFTPYANNYSVDRNDGNWNYGKESRGHIKNEVVQNFYDGNYNNFNNIANYGNAHSSISVNMGSLQNNVYNSASGNNCNNSNNNSNNNGHLHTTSGTNSNNRGSCNNNMNKFNGSKYGQVNGSMLNKSGRMPMGTPLTNTTLISNREPDVNSNFNNNNFNNVNYNPNSGFNANSNFNSNTNFNNYNIYGNYNYNNNTNNNTANNNGNNEENVTNFHNTGYNGNGLVYSSNSRGSIDSGNSKITRSVFNDMARNVSNNINDMNNMNGMDMFQNMEMGEYNNFANMNNFNNVSNSLSIENMNNIGNVNNMNEGFNMGNMSNHMNGMNMNVNQLSIGTMNTINNFNNMGEMNKNSFQMNCNTSSAADGMLSNHMFCANMNYNNYNNSHAFLNNMNYNSYGISNNSVTQMNSYNNLTNINNMNINNTNGISGINAINGMSFNYNYGNGNKMNTTFNNFSNNQMNYTNMIPNMNNVNVIKKNEMGDGDINEKNGRHDTTNTATGAINMNSLNKNVMNGMHNVNRTDKGNNGNVDLDNGQNNNNNTSNNSNNNHNNHNNRKSNSNNNSTASISAVSNISKNKNVVNKMNNKHTNFKGTNMNNGTGIFKNAFKTGTGYINETSDTNVVAINTKNRNGESGNGGFIRNINRGNINNYEQNANEIYSFSDMGKSFHMNKSGGNDFNRNNARGSMNFVNDNIRNGIEEEENNIESNRNSTQEDGSNAIDGNESKNVKITNNSYCNFSTKSATGNENSQEFIKREAFTKNWNDSLNQFSLNVRNQMNNVNGNDGTLMNGSINISDTYLNNDVVKNNNGNYNNPVNCMTGVNTTKKVNQENSVGTKKPNKHDNSGCDSSNKNHNSNNKNGSENNDNDDVNNNEEENNDDNNNNDDQDDNNSNNNNGNNNNNNNGNNNNNNNNNNNGNNNNNNGNNNNNNNNGNNNNNNNNGSNSNNNNGNNSNNNNDNNNNNNTNDNNNYNNSSNNKDHSGSNNNNSSNNNSNGDYESGNNESNTNNDNNNSRNDSNNESEDTISKYNNGSSSSSNNCKQNNDIVDGVGSANSSNNNSNINCIKVYHNINNSSVNSTINKCDSNNGRNTSSVCSNKPLKNITNNNHPETEVINKCYGDKNRNSDDKNDAEKYVEKNKTSEILQNGGQESLNYNMKNQGRHSEASTSQNSNIDIEGSDDANVATVEKKEKYDSPDTDEKHNLRNNITNGYINKNGKTRNTKNRGNPFKKGNKSGQEYIGTSYNYTSTSIEGNVQMKYGNAYVHSGLSKNENKTFISGNEMNQLHNVADDNNDNNIYNNSLEKTNFYRSNSNLIFFKENENNNTSLCRGSKFDSLGNSSNENSFVPNDMNVNNSCENHCHTDLGCSPNVENTLKEATLGSEYTKGNGMNVCSLLRKSATENMNFSRTKSRYTNNNNNNNAKTFYSNTSLKNVKGENNGNNYVNKNEMVDFNDVNNLNGDNNCKKSQNTQASSLYGRNCSHKSDTNKIITAICNNSIGSFHFMKNCANDCVNFYNGMNSNVINNFYHKI